MTSKRIHLIGDSDNRPKFSVTRQRWSVNGPQFHSETRTLLTVPSAFLRTSSTKAACMAPGRRRRIKITSPGATSGTGRLPRHSLASPGWRLPGLLLDVICRIALLVDPVSTVSQKSWRLRMNGSQPKEACGPGERDLVAERAREAFHYEICFTGRLGCRRLSPDYREPGPLGCVEPIMGDLRGVWGREGAGLAEKS